MPQYKDIRKPGLGSLNMDDDPASMVEKGFPQDYTDALNMRVSSSDTQHGMGVAETLQGEFEVLLDVEADFTSYYGEAIGGEFLYTGYEEVQIGDQVWMKNNWDADYPGSKEYNDDEDNVDEYGRLYTHGMVMADDFCPDNYRVPTEDDIDELLEFLGGALIAGGPMKELWTEHWLSPNTGATNSSGFKALPGGKYDIAFSLLQQMGLFWLQDEAEPLPPVLTEPTDIDKTSFIIHWLMCEGATGYKIDVAEDEDFTSFVVGYEDLDVGNVSEYEVLGLIANTQYYFRARAYNEIGTSENSEINFTQTTYDVIDYDGNVYDIITIGTQQWFVQNLKVTHYRDGTPIPNLTLDDEWVADRDGAYCWYDNNIANKATYGALYNSHALRNTHGLAPFGWRTPTQDDWETLCDFVGNLYTAGGQLKEVGLDHWAAPNLGAVDAYGFTALPGGARETETALFIDMGNYGWFWTKTGDTGYPYPPYYHTFNVKMSYNNEAAYPNLSECSECGMSVRCVRDI